LAKRSFLENVPFAICGRREERRRVQGPSVVEVVRAHMAEAARERREEGAAGEVEAGRSGMMGDGEGEVGGGGAGRGNRRCVGMRRTCGTWDRGGRGAACMRMKSTQQQRLAFGKSAIHGWGVFAKMPHRAGDMIIEYGGEVVRPVVADLRERRCYDSLVGAGTYMFRIDGNRVVDATRAGTIAHLINHSCNPNCYSRVVLASAEERIVIFARRDIRAGEELTYDYRFDSQDEQLACNCGSSACRGVVNILKDGDDDADGDVAVWAPRSELEPWRPQAPSP
ncbi:hypothetical protein CLOM_g21700, partial [Closterium sp. NIES-68]